MNDDWSSWSGVAAIRQQCEARAASEGLAGLELFFRAQQLFQDRLAARPSYRERQADWRERQKQAGKSCDPLRRALEAIRDGHNDPRGLARETMEATPKEGEK